MLFLTFLCVITGVFAAPTVSGSVLKFKVDSTHRSVGLGLDPDAYRNATSLITSKGYPCENYYVTTEDGYILNILRIPHGKKTKPRFDSSPRPAVLLQHGLEGACTNFLTNPANESLAYILADAGADVWLGNSRGNFYALNHTHLSPKQREFWDFTFDEMAKYDLPAVIKFIVSSTGQDQIYYAGHSQGTSIAFAEFSQDQTVASHIKHMFALAPIGRVGLIKSPIRLLAPFAHDISLFLNLFGHGEFMLEPQFLRYIQGDLCEKWRSDICANLLFLMCGFDEKSMNMSRVPVYLTHMAAGTSTKNILHFAQEVNSKQFQMFDFGSGAENMKHYNQTTPPLYQPSKMRTPVAMFRGGNDWMADDTDVDWLMSQLPNVTHDVFIEHYEHLDFIWAMDSPTYIYNKIVQIIFGK